MNVQNKGGVMNCIYRWIHISDIHFQTKNVSFNTKQLKDTLPNYIKGKFAGNVDGMFITGDYRYAPDQERNAAKSVEFIKNCAAALGIDEKYIYTAPGNHDLSRTTSRPYMVYGVRNKYIPEKGIIESAVVEVLQNDFAFYQDVHRELGDASEWKSDNPHCVIDVGPFALIILNTALTACGENDEGSLIIGSSFLDACVSRIEGNKPVVMMGHHGLDWLNEEERSVCVKYLENKGITFYLCGHAHEAGFSSFGERIKQVNVGCIIQDEKEIYAGFSVGELFDDGSINISTHKWDIKQQVWVPDMALARENIAKLDLVNTGHAEASQKEKVEKDEYPFSIEGYHLLGGLGEDGIKYMWKKGDSFVESLAFNRKSKLKAGGEEDPKISAYTISTSVGCQLAVSGDQCLFCGTGKRSFVTNLKAEEIALQCIFMGKYDSNCPSYPQVHDNKREFAFMGQGEPGINYTAIREAILLNDFAMERISQDVSRYIICTSGITDFIPTLAEDIKRGVYKNPVTVHFSLNAIEPERSELMPVNKTHDYREFLDQCKLLYQITHIKIGIGLLMFSNYKLSNSKEYTLTADKLNSILDELDSDVFRIDLCTVNKCGKGKQGILSKEIAEQLLEVVVKKGFEGKIFSSFGESDKSGCGMLDSNEDEIAAAGNTTIECFNRAVELLKEAKVFRKMQLIESK